MCLFVILCVYKSSFDSIIMRNPNERWYPMTNQALAQHLRKHFSLEFFEPCIALINLHVNTPGMMHAFVPGLERVLLERLPEKSEYHLIFNPIPKRDESFSPDDLESIHLHMKSLAAKFTCRSAYFIMNESLHFHINRAAAEPYCTHGVHRTASLGEAINRIEDDHGIEIIFDSLPVSCC